MTRATSATPQVREEILYKVKGGEGLSPEQAMILSFGKKCIRAAPGSPDARGFGVGTIMVRRDSVTVVCDLAAMTFYPPAGLKCIAIPGPDKHSMGFYPGSELIYCGFHILVCRPDMHKSEMELAKIINEWTAGLKKGLKFPGLPRNGTASNAEMPRSFVRRTKNPR